MYQSWRYFCDEEPEFLKFDYIPRIDHRYWVRSYGLVYRMECRASGFADVDQSAS